MTPKKVIFVVVFFLTVAVLGCTQGLLHKRTSLFMGTYFDIEVPRSSPSSAEAVNEAYRRIKKLDELFSAYRDDNELARINAFAASEPVKISEDMFSILKCSLAIGEKSKGAFDITVGPALDAWGFGKKRNFQIPSREKIAEALRLIGSDNIELDRKNSTLFLKKRGMRIDLGGIAKGYAIDEAVKVLKKYGINSGIVKGGGEMHLLGARPDGRPWVIGIRDPRNKDAVIAKIGLKDISIATSGNYENYFVKDGVRFSHIINPKTGTPLEEEPMSVTVLCPNSTDCDAFATAVYVLGKERGMEFVEKEAVACLIVFVEKGALKIIKSKNFDRLCEFYEEIN